MRDLIIVASACALMSAFATAQAAGDPAAGKAKAAMCAACHGLDGNGGVNPLWPKLAGQKPEYLVKAMKDYKSGNRTEPQMKPMMAPLSETDMENLAAWFSSQEQK